MSLRVSAQFANTLDPTKPLVARTLASTADELHDEAQALLECLWVFEEHRVPNLELLKRVFTAKEPRVRAAAIRTLGHWAGKIENWETTLLAAANDESALVRAEAVKSAVDLGGPAAAETVLHRKLKNSGS